MARHAKPLRTGAAAVIGLALAATWLVQPILMVGVLAGLFYWLAAARQGRQALAITWVGLATIPERLGATSVVVVGIAGVVAVLVAMQSMAAGFEATVTGSGDDETAIVLRAGANAEVSSVVERSAVPLIMQAPGVRRDTRDVPIATADVVLVATVPRRSTGADANLEVRGVSPMAWQVRPQVRIVAGRRFEPGRRELIVGQGARDQFQGLEIGDELRMNNEGWRIVGVFESGDTHESEVWTDAETLAAAHRRNGFQSVVAALASPAAIETLRAALAADPRLRVDVDTTRAYYTQQSERLTTIIRVVGTGVAIIMALGAVFGALNTMYTAVSQRAREIATLRALGFTAAPVVVSILLETMTLALAGGVLGGGIAWALFNGFTVSTLGSNFSQVVFQFQVTAQLLGRGLQWALGIGLLGGLLPALRAATQPVTVALRES
ncbi:ABC-type transport system, involved in lipoprotein release, permease component [Thioflavicoccus mobilis 8321]|uniref:ABC-type transport system, involved in lipoprotein release, permease component n=1 Tax=Thioflavicoccus mobilis 8321 TaxID=765912 RepID=L0GVV1_9GAMM|nr:ABC transporter permease [Thioflavicoccus mobilis]AGA89475.1 ABC-type transport system, involved in lipoprotein release, permease component [Thioflavicoccus mobilis 8321]